MEYTREQFHSMSREKKAEALKSVREGKATIKDYNINYEVNPVKNNTDVEQQKEKEYREFLKKNYQVIECPAEETKEEIREKYINDGIKNLESKCIDEEGLLNNDLFLTEKENFINESNAKFKQEDDAEYQKHYDDMVKKHYRY